MDVHVQGGVQVQVQVNVNANRTVLRLEQAYSSSAYTKVGFGFRKSRSAMTLCGTAGPST